MSKHITALENCLDGRLHNRTIRHINLTEAGQAYYERCKQIIEDVEEAKCVVTGFSSEPRGLLRMSAPMSFGIKQFADSIADFCLAHPAIDIELTLTDRFVDVVEEGYDLVILIAQLKESSLIARKLAPCRCVLWPHRTISKHTDDRRNPAILSNIAACTTLILRPGKLDIIRFGR